jgi:general L-amino acid transport system permease protein
MTDMTANQVPAAAPAHRPGEHPDLPPPMLVSGPVAWLKRNFFSSISNSILTILALILLYVVIPPMVDWAFVQANFGGGLRTTKIFELKVLESTTGLTEQSTEANASGAFDAKLTNILIPGNTPGAIIGKLELVNLPEQRQATYTLSDSRFEIRGGDLKLLPSVTIDPATEPTVTLAVIINGASRGDCPKPGACWVMVNNRFSQFIYGFYPSSERWRIDLTLLLFVIAAGALLIDNVPGKRYWALFMFVGFPILAFELLVGGHVFSHVPTDKWGGLMLTLVIAIVGIVASIPLGILLALARRSFMPVNHLLSVLFIEFIRGVPLISILFMANVMLPLFLPKGVTFDILLRILIGVTLFSAAYVAEVVRGGLQAIPKGQFEGAMAMGLGYWQMMRLVVLPQALRISIPGLVNTSIGLFKDTTLVAIVGLYDFLNIIKASTKDQNWLGLSMEGYVFAAAVYWVFCFGMSRYSMYLERKLHTGHKKR